PCPTWPATTTWSSTGWPPTPFSSSASPAVPALPWLQTHRYDPSVDGPLPGTPPGSAATIVAESQLHPAARRRGCCLAPRATSCGSSAVRSAAEPGQVL